MKTNVHFIGGFGRTKVCATSFPLMQNLIPAGFPSPAEDFIDQNLDLNEYLVSHPAATFFVRVRGNGLHQIGIYESDILVVDRSLTPDSEGGNVVVAAIEGELLVRRYKKVKDQIWLLADPQKESPVVVGGARECEVWGVVTAVIRKGGFSSVASSERSIND